MKAFEYAVPTSIGEASELLRQDGAAALAGGSQLLLTFKWLPPPKLLVNIKRLPGLRNISAEGDEVWIGALTTLADIRRSTLLAERFPVLGIASRLMAVPSVATMATVGGNIAWASPQADLVQPLLALDAQVELSGGAAMPLRDFFAGPGKTALQPGELITGVRLRGSGRKAVYLRHSTRRLADAQICSVALTEQRAVLGSCGPTPVVVDLPSGLALAEAVDLVASHASPRDDFRASGAYRMKIVRVLARRGLEYLHAY
ncbi:MAG: FAD binding domain-containing protein [Chloroflexota bacterium]